MEREVMRMETTYISQTKLNLPAFSASLVVLRKLYGNILWLVFCPAGKTFTNQSTKLVNERVQVRNLILHKT